MKTKCDEYMDAPKMPEADSLDQVREEIMKAVGIPAHLMTEKSLVRHRLLTEFEGIKEGEAQA